MGTTEGFLRLDSWKPLSLILAILLSPLLLQPFSFDNDVFQAMGWALQRYGSLPYLGSWDQNFPGMVFIHAGVIGLLGTSPLAFRAVDLLFHFAYFLVLYRILSLYVDSRVAWYSTLFACAFYVYGGEWMYGQRDGFGTGFLILATFAFMLAVREHCSWPRLLMWAAGLIFGFAVSFRPTIGFVLFAAMVYIYLASKDRWRSILYFLFGSSVVWLLLVLFYALKPDGLHQFYLAVIKYNADIYGTSDFRFPLYWILRKPQEWIVDAILLAYWLLPKIRTSQLVPKNKALIYLFWGYYISARISIIVMGKYYIQHYDLLLLMSGVLLGIIVVEYAVPIVQRYIRRPDLATALIIIVFTTALSPIPLFVYHLAKGSTYPLRETWRSYSYSGTRLTDEMILVDYLRPRIAANERIECWGFDPGIFWMLDRRESSRFTTSHPLMMRRPGGEFTDYQTAWQQEYIDSLRSTRPLYIIISTDESPIGWYIKSPPSAQLSVIPGFTELLDSQYSLDTTIVRWLVYRRKAVGA